uniref:Reverse transcriptase domain-containing protein n=1 Tax=Halochlorococcum sp. NIES-1838 TaxID=2249730 RepID=A0A2Z4M9W4_9CHLO|nr:hypothetical protein [Halochlorococcum sp. NIES-1838]
MTTKQDFAEKWKGLPWKSFEKNLFRLQHRIYKANQKNDPYLVYRLQCLILGSPCARYLAVRQVSQLNMGKKTAGVDGVSSLSPKQRLELAEELKNLKNWKHQELKRVYIPKPNGEQRPLGIPTIRDRAMQCLIKYSLEPVYESIASRGSYGFRPGRSTWDIQTNIFLNLQSIHNGYNKSILVLDIEKCFDKIDHQKLMCLINLPKPAKQFVWSALRAGVLNERPITIEGTPQGGVISPLLCNIALQGIEDIWNKTRSKNRISQRGLRYADDLIYFIKPNEDVTLLRNKIDKFLADRKLNVKESKTKLVKSTEGFDFLGWHFKVRAKNHKFISYPTIKNRRNLINKIKTTMKDTRYTLDQRLNKVKIIYTGWWNYNKYCDMGQINLWSINSWVNNYVKLNSKMPRKKRTEIIKSIFTGHSFKVNAHVSVAGNRSPYDNDWLYWAKRNCKRYFNPLLRVATKQNYKCQYCGNPFRCDDIIELHHLDGNNKNNRISNYVVLHRYCHQHQKIHSEKRIRKVHS